jgi:hypothetical protein
MGSILILRYDRSLTGQDLLSMNMECWNFFFNYKQVDLHSDSLGPLMHTLSTFKFIVKFVSPFCCLYWITLLSLWCLNNGPTSQDSLPVPYLHQFSLLPGKKIVCNLLCLFLLKLLVIQTQELFTTACFLHVPHVKIWRFWWQFCSRKFHAFHQPWLCKLKPVCTTICYLTC